MKTALLSSAYFGPVQWYQKLHRYDRCLIEQYDNFVKQTYRNRCIIPTTNGIQALSIPVSCPQGSQLSKTPMRDVRISDHGTGDISIGMHSVRPMEKVRSSTIIKTTCVHFSNENGRSSSISIWKSS